MTPHKGQKQGRSRHAEVTVRRSYPDAMNHADALDRKAQHWRELAEGWYPPTSPRELRALANSAEDVARRIRDRAHQTRPEAERAYADAVRQRRKRLEAFTTKAQ